MSRAAAAFLQGMNQGMDANARKRELAQQQANLDRQFQFSQQREANDEAWRQQQQAQQQQEWQMRKDEAAQRLARQRADASIYDAVGTPMQMPEVQGQGPQQPHPADMLGLDAIAGASPEAQRTFAGFRQDRNAFGNERAQAQTLIEQAKAGGMLKSALFVDGNGKPSKLLDMAQRTGLLNGIDPKDMHPSVFGGMAPDEEAERQGYLDYLTIEQDPASGLLQSNAQMGQRLQQMPVSLLKQYAADKMKADERAALTAQTMDLGQRNGFSADQAEVLGPTGMRQVVAGSMLKGQAGGATPKATIDRLKFRATTAVNDYKRKYKADPPTEEEMNLAASNKPPRSWLSSDKTDDRAWNDAKAKVAAWNAIDAANRELDAAMAGAAGETGGEGFDIDQLIDELMAE